MPAPPATRRCGRSGTASRRRPYFGALDPRFATVVDDEDATRAAPGRRAGRRPVGRGRRLDRPAGRDRRRGRQRRCPCRRPRRDGHRARPDGHDHGHLDLPHGPRARGADGARDVRLRRGRDPPRSHRLRGRPVVRRRPLLVVRRAGPARRPTATRPRARASTSTPSSRRRPARQRVGESGLLALDWWNGNRSVLVDAAVGGLLIGATLATTPEEIYRALIEATAYRDARHHRDVRGERRPDPRGRRLRRAGREEPADPPDLRRRHRAARSG